MQQINVGFSNVEKRESAKRVKILQQLRLQIENFKQQKDEVSSSENKSENRAGNSNETREKVQDFCCAAC